MTYCNIFYNTIKDFYQRAAFLTGVYMVLLFHVFCLSFKETKRLHPAAIAI